MSLAAVGNSVFLDSDNIGLLECLVLLGCFILISDCRPLGNNVPIVLIGTIGHIGPQQRQPAIAPLF